MKNIFSLFLVVTILIFSCTTPSPSPSPPDEPVTLRALPDSSIEDHAYGMTEEAEAKITKRLAMRSASNAVYTYPVVVHVLHTGEATSGNISDAQVYSAIEGLNQCYSATGIGTGPKSTNTNIQFALAKRDPNGNPTTGIVRKDLTSVPNYAVSGIKGTRGVGADEAVVKAQSIWPIDKYINVWVVTEIDGNDGGAGTQGYATLSPVPGRDGIVILNSCFGVSDLDKNGQPDPQAINFTLKSYTNMGRTFAHEMGHYFSLYHTFQGYAYCQAITETSCNTQGDFVCDTPPTVTNAGCAATCVGSQALIENYMDYTYQSCQNMFTPGQVARMRGAAETIRFSQRNSNSLLPPVNLDAGIRLVATDTYACSADFKSSVAVTNTGSTPISNFTINGVTYNIAVASGSSVTVNVNFNRPAIGSYTLPITLELVNGQVDGYLANNVLSANVERINGGIVEVEVKTDVFPTDNSWEIVSGTGARLAYHEPYSKKFAVEKTTVCLPSGSYQLRFFDQYGDGMTSTTGYLKVTANGVQQVYSGPCPCQPSLTSATSTTCKGCKVATFNFSVQ